ncbi:MAG: MBL fold metallo-hydrolase [bacterium]|nr:MBL fold metallo-hydrolase [bacterium]
MEFKQIYTPGLAHCSYIIGDKTSCIVVDPAREVKQYIDIAQSFGSTITAIFETHLHADFVSGHVELAKLTGAKIYISKKANAQFEHYALNDEEEIEIGSLLIKMIDTPGHTPEGSVFIVSDLERGREPALIFSGDTLLIGDAGRPDLFPHIKNELASKLYDSLQKIADLGDSIEVYPAHGAGSLCGKALSSKLSSTIGIERRHNGAMQIHPKQQFVESLLAGMPEVPDHFSRCSEINRLGPAIVAALPKPMELSPDSFFKAMEAGSLVLDTRDQLSFAAAHIPGAYGLSLKGNFATFSGWVMPPDKPILLVLDSTADLEVSLRALRSVGLDKVDGFLEGGMTAWANRGFLTARMESMSVMELKECFYRREVILVDTRLKSEWDAMRVEGSIHAPAPDIRIRYQEWRGDVPVAFICNSGNRSLLAGSLMLKKSPQQKVINIIGGTATWAKLGYPTVKGAD